MDIRDILSPYINVEKNDSILKYEAKRKNFILQFVLFLIGYVLFLSAIMGFSFENVIVLSLIAFIALVTLGIVLSKEPVSVYVERGKLAAAYVEFYFIKKMVSYDASEIKSISTGAFSTKGAHYTASVKIRLANDKLIKVFTAWRKDKETALLHSELVAKMFANLLGVQILNDTN